MSVEAWLGARRESVERTLERLLPRPEGPARRLAEALRYAVLGGGKRLRPLLALASCEACGGAPQDVLEPAAAIEMIHAYSLVHDDLPAMDDDDLRRGRPTVHREFDEASAILAGDALLTLAFEVLARFPVGDERVARRADAVLAVARAAGIEGMAGGQQADLDAEGRAIEAAELEWIHRRKTGALIVASAELGAIHAGADPAARAALVGYARALGLAFQIADDILDRTATAEALGKTPGKDQSSRKATYPALHGLEASRREAERLVEVCLAELARAGLETAALVHLARSAVSRER